MKIADPEGTELRLLTDSILKAIDASKAKNVEIQN